MTEIWPSREDIRQNFQNANVLKRRSGGGIVFPNGLLGRGLRLDEADFGSFCADPDSVIPSPGPPYAGPRVLLTTAIVSLLIAGVMFGQRSLASTPFYWTDVALVLAAVLFVSVTWVTAARRRRAFLARFPSADHVRRGRFLGRRLLGMMAAGVHNVWRSLYNAALFLFIGTYGADAWFWGAGRTPATLTLLVACIIIAGVFHLAFVVAHLGYRMARGHAPTPADLEPV